jgi:hypothetical protein
MHGRLYGLLAALSFAACLASGVIFFLGCVEPETYRKTLAASSLAWFLSAAAWSGRKRKSPENHGESNSAGM